MKRIAMIVGLLALSGCGGETPSEDVEAVTSALSTSKFTAWQAIPGGPPGTSNFWGRPAIYTDYTNASNRDWSVCESTTVPSILCTDRIIAFGHDYGWQAWGGPLATPAGVSLGAPASSPAVTRWYDNSNAVWNAFAGREVGGSCPDCIWIDINQQAGSNTWYLVPNSGPANGFGATDFSLVASNEYIYIVASKCSGSTCTATYTQNYVGNGYSNAGWSSWVADTAGGVFLQPVIANALPNRSGGSLIVSGLGLDSHAWFSRIFAGGSWEGGWSTTSAAGVFDDSPSATTFSLGASDLELFGLGTNTHPYEGSYNSSRTVFDGYYQLGSVVSYHSPASFAPVANIIDLAVDVDFIDGTAIVVSDYAGP